MQIRELSQPVTSKMLNESLAKKFGYRLQLENFSNVQLNDAVNKLRTRISQYELSEAYDSVLESPEYQKTRLMLDCLNQEIQEREMNEGAKPDFLDMDKDGDKKEPMKKAVNDKKKAKKVEETYAVSQFRKRAQQHSIPTAWIDNALARIQLGESDNEELKAELKLRYDLNESTASWLLLEGEESKAEIIMATKDMVDRVTGWLEDVAAMKAEQLLELQDSIREEIGSDVAQQYGDAVKPALEAIYTALETSRQGLQGALSLVSGGQAPTMGAPGAELGAAPVPGAEAIPGEAEAALDAEMTPPAPEAGREKRESVDYSRRLGMLLNSKKK